MGQKIRLYRFEQWNFVHVLLHEDYQRMGICKATKSPF